MKLDDLLPKPQPIRGATRAQLMDPMPIGRLPRQDADFRRAMAKWQAEVVELTLRELDRVTGGAA